MTKDNAERRLCIRGMDAEMQLWRDTKANAAKRGKTVAEVTAEALRLYLKEQSKGQ